MSRPERDYFCFKFDVQLQLIPAYQYDFREFSVVFYLFYLYETSRA